MITIQFFRFESTNRMHKDRLVFKTLLHNEIRYSEQQLTFAKAHYLVKKWLKDHYGYCKIYQDNQGEDDQGVEVKVCNHKKLVNYMNQSDISILVIRYEG